MSKLTVCRYRVVRYGHEFLLQKWFDRSWFWRAGWYSYWNGYDGSGWTADNSHYTVKKFRSRADAESALREQVRGNLPEPDIEPVGALDADGEGLRAAAEASGPDDAPKLVYADWCDEHGLANNAARIRIEVEAMRAAERETTNAIRTGLG